MTYVNLLFSPAAPTPQYWHFSMDRLKGTCVKAWKKSLWWRLAVHFSSQKHRLFFSHQKTWKCRAPHSTAPISWWYPAVHSVGWEKCNSNDSISWGRGTSTCQIRRSTAQHQPVHRSGTLPWYACQNESGGWHTGIRVKECVCVCVCVLNKNPPSPWNCSSMPEEMHHRPYWENCGSVVFNY